MLNGKPLRPSLREKKRYLVYEADSEEPIKDFFAFQNKVVQEINKLLGVFDASAAGVQSLKTHKDKPRGILRVNHKYVDKIRSCFVLISSIGGQDVRLRTVGVSGIIKKAKEQYFDE